MPGPAAAVYVAVAIGAVAAAIAFKELVYDPHFRPRISAWRESTRRRQRARPHVYTASSSSPPPEGDVARTSPRRDTHRKKKYPRRPVESTKHIELQHVIASEVESLKSSAEADGDNRGIRQRRIGESQNLCDHPMENSGLTSGSNSTQPRIALEDRNISDDVALGSTNRPSDHIVPTSPPALSAGTYTESPIRAVNSGDTTRSSGTPLPPGVRESLTSQTPVLIEIPHVPETSLISGPSGFVTPRLIPFDDPENARPSSPDTDFLSPSDIDLLSADPFLSPHDPTLSPRSVHGTTSPTLSSDFSVDFLSSASFSPPGSPFVGAGMYRGLVESRGDATAQRNEVPSGVGSSPNVTGATPTGPTFLVRGSSEVFSLPSQASSDGSSDEGDYDMVSVLESEASNWTSDVADGEGAAQR